MIGPKRTLLSPTPPGCWRTRSQGNTQFVVEDDDCLPLARVLSGRGACRHLSA
jgi:hypothetical protein